MTASLLNPQRQDFERHIKRLAWCALLAVCALLIPTTEAPIGFQLQLASALAAVVVCVAVWAGARDAGRYIRAERLARREATDASRRAGACLAADAIQDRIANLLSVTVGYVEFLVQDEDLPGNAREQAGKALDASLAAARAISTFRRALGCSESGPPMRVNEAVQQLAAIHSNQAPVPADATWAYEASTGRIMNSDGAVVATLAGPLDSPSTLANGRLVAAAPALWSTLADAQQLGAKLLVRSTRGEDTEDEIRQIVDKINQVAAGLDP